MINMKNHDNFIMMYNEIDSFMRKEMGLDDRFPHSNLIRDMACKNRVFSRYKEELLSFARLRNAIVHNPNIRNADPIADPHDYVIKQYRKILDSVLSPPKAIDSLAIKGKDVYTAGLDDRALEIMKVMNDNIFTHVPILEYGKLIGVFSENTVFSYIVNTGDILLEKDIKIAEFSEFIPIDKHESESFVFVSRNALVIDVEDMFIQQFQKGKRLAVVFITHSGNPKEQLLGLITPWDMAGYEEK
jgi:CBS domain-containing protein